MLPFWKFFIDKRAFSYLLIATLVIAGSFALRFIPKESTPEVIIPVATVVTSFPGASAEDVEKLLTDKIESQVQNLDNLDTVASQSQEGVSIITVQFSASADIDTSIEDLKQAVDRTKSELPTEADDPIVTKISFSNQPILTLSVSSDKPEAALAELGDNLKDEIKKVTGVSDVSVSGVRPRETQVLVRKEDLNKYGLSLTSIVQALQVANTSMPIGSIETNGVNYAVKFRGSIDDPREVGDIVLTTQNGIPIYIRDVALVSDGIAQASSNARISINGSPSEQALTINVFKRAGGDITKIDDAVKEKLEELQKNGGILFGSQVLISFDAADQVRADLTNLTKIGFETVLLVMLCLFLTIGWRESVVAALSIPLSFLISFIGLQASGNTLNVVSLFSLILAIGILVDSGIVVTEAIHTRYKKLGNAKEAAYQALREYAWPLIGGTMATVTFFVPLFFISGIVGQFIKSIPFTLIFVLVASIFVALGFVPLIAVLFSKKEMNRLEKFQELWNDKIREWYKRFLHVKLEDRRFQKRFLWAIAILFVVALSFPATGLVKVTFFPQEDIDYIYAEIEKPQGTPLAISDLSAREVEEVLYDREKFPEIESFTTTVGGSSAFSGNPQNGARLGSININLSKDRERSSTEVVAAIRKEVAHITSATIRIEEPNNGPPTGAPVLIKVTGDNFSDIERTAEEVERVLTSIPGTIDVRSSFSDDGNDFAVSIDRAKASELGLNPAIIGQTLRTAVNGVTATTIRRPEGDIDIVVKLNIGESTRDPSATAKATIDAVKQIPIQTAQGPVLLGSVLNTSLEKSRATISHEDNKRIVTVSSRLLPGVTAPEISSAFNAERKKINVPQGVSVEFGGENEDVNTSFRDLFLALVGGMVLTLGVLVLVFNSFRYSAYLLGIVPLSLIGVMVGLAISFQPLSFPSILGIIALAGVIINHAIILLDSMIHYYRSHVGDPLIDIVTESAATRLRPIVLTTLTTVVGMIPLTTGTGLWSPIAFTIMFGLTFSMVLSLLFIPILFYRYHTKHPLKLD